MKEVAWLPSYCTRCRSTNPCLPQQRDTIPYAAKISVLCSWRWAKDCPKHVELILEINKWLLLHLVGFSMLHHLHGWCTVKHKSSYWHSLNLEVRSHSCCLSMWIDSPCTGRLFTKFSTVGLVLKIIRENSDCVKIWWKLQDTLTWRCAYIYGYVLWVLKWPWLPCLLTSSQLILWLTWLPSLRMLWWFSIVTGVHCLQWFCVLLCWHFFISKFKHDKFGHCCFLWLHTGYAEILLSGCKFEILAKGFWSFFDRAS